MQEILVQLAVTIVSGCVIALFSHWLSKRNISCNRVGVMLD
ncbi:type I toxin-antitoxin system Fst family toxin [Staphylococcus ursi]|nr:type I toxin-antitoxin system Fst family toxin [Staphylococcus sp. MI 10-1553]QHW35908.1 type I toxin-antitoxin system Fst family toxin [Staphylococcus sp. MI 10-1553]